MNFQRSHPYLHHLHKAIGGERNRFRSWILHHKPDNRWIVVPSTTPANRKRLRKLVKYARRALNGR